MTGEATPLGAQPAMPEPLPPEAIAAPLEPPVKKDVDGNDGKRYAEVLDRSRRRMKEVTDYDLENCRAQDEDTAFVYVPDKQWDPAVRAERTAMGDQCLEFPQLKQFVNQVVNDQRQNRPGIRVHPEGGQATVDTAKLVQGIVRAIETDSQAEAVYDCAYQNAVLGGRGYFRIKSEYESANSFNQVLKFVRVPDSNTCKGDPYFQNPDGSDRNYFFVLENMHKDEFKEKWPKAAEVSYENAEEASRGYWFSDQDHVWVCDYYERVGHDRELIALHSGMIGFRDEIEKVFASAGGQFDEAQIKLKRTSTEYTINVYQIAGGQQILSESTWPGEIIPVVCTMGDEITVEGKRIYQGLIRQAKSAQAMFNYGMTNQAIHLALTPRAPWVAEFRQLEGLDTYWKDANKKNISVLPYHMVVEDGMLAPPPQRQPPSSPDAGWFNWTQQMQGLMRSTTGIYDPSLGQKSNETSGIAIRQREQQGDTATFHYADNLARAIALGGRILVAAIPYYYDAHRAVQIIGEDGERKVTPINVPQTPAPDQMAKGITDLPKKNDLKLGRYSAAVSAGPSYQTKRQEAAELMVDLAKAYPPIMQAAGDIIIGAQDVPDADRLAKRLRAIAPPPILAMIAAEDAGEDPKYAAMQQELQKTQQGAQQQIQGMGAELQRLTQENEQLKADKTAQITVANAKVEESRIAAQSKAAEAERAGMREDRQLALDEKTYENDSNKVLIDFIKAVTPILQMNMMPAVPAIAQEGKQIMADQ